MEKEQKPEISNILRCEGCTVGLRFTDYPELFADKIFEWLQIIANFIHPVNGKRDFVNDHNRKSQYRWLNRVLRQLYVLIKLYFDSIQEDPRFNEDYI